MEVLTASTISQPSRGAAGKFSLSVRTFSQELLQNATVTAIQNIGYATNVPTSAPFAELHQSLASRADAISPFVDQLMRFIRLLRQKVGKVKENEDEIEVALREALANAVIHGNREENRKARLYHLSFAAWMEKY